VVRKELHFKKRILQDSIELKLNTFFTGSVPEYHFMLDVIDVVLSGGHTDSVCHMETGLVVRGRVNPSKDV
jgi:hypothetical protein